MKTINQIIVADFGFYIFENDIGYFFNYKQVQKIQKSTCLSSLHYLLSCLTIGLVLLIMIFILEISIYLQFALIWLVICFLIYHFFFNFFILKIIDNRGKHLFYFDSSNSLVLEKVVEIISNCKQT